MTTADQIPVAHTPPGGWQGEMPAPILAERTESLAHGAPDLRGLWQAVSVDRGGQAVTGHVLNNHIERIEQAGDRVVITASGIIHDMRADGTLEHGVNDVLTANTDERVRVAAVFHEGRLDLHPLGVHPDRKPLVTREIVDGQLHWHYGPFHVILKRI